MNGNTYLLIFLSLFAALLVSYIWYRSQKVKNNLFRWLFLLRGLALWALLLLLINPDLKDYTVVVEKPELNILVDNSASVGYLADTSMIREQLAILRDRDALLDKFEVKWYAFGQELDALDSVPGFKAPQTNIAKALQGLKNIQSSSPSVTLLISDGNSTYGGDYQFNTAGLSGPVYAVVAGDTTQFEDLYVERVNVNRYAYLNNKFPVEIFVGYKGKREASFRLEILENDQVIFREEGKVDKGMSGIPLKAELQAGKTGVRSYRVRVSPLPDEKNDTNNQTSFAVEVIDERNRIALVSNVLHPDLGSLKKSIEQSGQRMVDLVSPEELKELEGYDLVITYQPDRRFSGLFQKLQKENKNFWVIGGEATDWNFVNTAQNFFEREITYSDEFSQGEMNAEFTSFQFEDPGINTYPPLNSSLGDFIIAAPYETLIYKSIGGVVTNSPLLFTVERNDLRMAVLDGNDLWKWRLWHFSNNESFIDYDTFWNKLIQYLASGVRKERLYVDYQPYYYANTGIGITAGYYDKNYQYDPNERLLLELKHADSVNARTLPLIASDRDYKIDLNGLPAGTYSFRVRVPSQNLTRAGEFSILGYEVERQFMNTDTRRMGNLAMATGGAMMPLADIEKVVDSLIGNNAYTPVQKREEKVVPLLDWQWLLFITVFFFGLEWFTRKYNGLI